MPFNSPVGKRSPQTPASSVTGPPNYTDAPVVGIETDYARSDHSHGLPAATGGSGTPATTVTGPDAFGASPIVGVQNTFARADHDHGLPASPSIPSASTTVIGPPSYGDAKVVGVATTYSRGDHSHGLPTSSGNPATTVTGPDAYGASAVVGSSQFFARADHDHGLPAAFDATSILTRLTTLEAQVAALGSPPAVGLGVIGTFPGAYGSSMANFITALSDMSIDTLQITGGTYSNWHDLAVGMDRTARPLLVQPVGGNVIWDGNGGSGDGLLYPGWGGTPCRWIKFDSAGTGFNFQINNFNLTQTGLISTDWCENCQFNGFHCTGTIAPTTNGMTAWHVYISSDGTHQGKNLTFNNWYADSSTGAAGHQSNGFQTYHAPGPTGTNQINNWTTYAGDWGAVVREGDGLNFSGWNIHNAGIPFDCGGGAGTVKNMTSTGSGSGPIINGGMVDGGGNSWA